MLTSEDEYSILELAKLIIDLTNSNSKIVYKELPEDDPKNRKPDITLAKNKLKWNPKEPLKMGIQKSVEYFTKIL